MPFSDLLRESFAVDGIECWQRERTPNALTDVGVRLTAAGLSIRETIAVLRLPGIDRSHGPVWQWIHRLADGLRTRRRPSRRGSPSMSWLSETTVISTGSTPRSILRHLLGGRLFEQCSTDPATAFLHSQERKYDFADTVFLVDGYGYLTALARRDLSSRLDYSFRNHIEKRFHILRMRIDRFYPFWVGSQTSVQQWLAVFVEYYNRQRPHQALSQRTPAVKVLN